MFISWMVITPSFKKSLIVEQFQGNYLKENSSREFTRLSWPRRFRKMPFSKCFETTFKTQSRHFQIPLVYFEERFRKAPFSWRISVDGWLNCRNKGAFLNFSGVGLRNNRTKKVSHLFVGFLVISANQRTTPATKVDWLKTNLFFDWLGSSKEANKKMLKLKKSVCPNTSRSDGSGLF